MHHPMQHFIVNVTLDIIICLMAPIVLRLMNVNWSSVKMVVLVWICQMTFLVSVFQGTLAELAILPTSMSVTQIHVKMEPPAPT